MTIFVKASDVPYIVLYLIQSSPTNSGPLNFGHQDEHQNAKLYKEFSGLTPFKTNKFKGITDKGNMLVLNNINTFALVDRNNKAVHYVMDYQIYPKLINGKQCVSQVEVWSGKEKDSVNGMQLPTFVFNTLIDTYDAVMTDQQQSPDGRKFWEKRITEAFKNGGRYLYALDISANLSITPLMTLAEFDSIKESLWGSNHDHLRVAIAKNKIW